MFWCMFVSDITAIYRDILQCLTGAQTFHSLYVMRICAVTCSLLQQSMHRTQNPPGFGPWGFDPPSRHHLKYQYPLWIQSFAAFVSALRSGYFGLAHCIKVRNQVRCASTVFSIAWICLQRTLFLLVSAIYARLRNAQRTWFRSSPRCGKSLHCIVP